MLEDNLLDTYQTVVLPHWETKGQTISFRARDGLAIHGMSFIQPGPQLGNRDFKWSD
jgi:hypothetical protein